MSTTVASEQLKFVAHVLSIKCFILTIEDPCSSEPGLTGPHGHMGKNGTNKGAFPLVRLHLHGCQLDTLTTLKFAELNSHNSSQRDEPVSASLRLCLSELITSNIGITCISPITPLLRFSGLTFSPVNGRYSLDDCI